MIWVGWSSALVEVALSATVGRRPGPPDRLAVWMAVQCDRSSRQLVWHRSAHRRAGRVRTARLVRVNRGRGPCSVLAVGGQYQDRVAVAAVPASGGPHGCATRVWSRRLRGHAGSQASPGRSGVVAVVPVELASAVPVADQRCAGGDEGVGVLASRAGRASVVDRPFGRDELAALYGPPLLVREVVDHAPIIASNDADGEPRPGARPQSAATSAEPLPR